MDTDILCDVPLEKILSKKLEFPKHLFKRALYAVQENRRTLRAASFLTNGEIEPVGELLYESHIGLSELYGVSCEELDFMVEYFKTVSRSNRFKNDGRGIWRLYHQLGA